MAGQLLFSLTAMGQRIVDSSVLCLFALMYSCAVFVLRVRRRLARLPNDQRADDRC